MRALACGNSLLKTALFRGLFSLILGAFVSATPESAWATTYYVRTDGGSPDQCTGLVNSPFPGSGDAQPCAWDHPFRALPPGGPARIIGGDTVIIGPGSYRMGFGAVGTEACSPEYPWDCFMTAVPSGPQVSNPTRILGAGWDSGCSSPPELWGAERANWIVNLTQSQNVEISCLEITDHSGCVEGHADPAFRCQRDSYPYGDWAAVGLYAEDSSNVVLKNLNIHGLAHTGIWAGRLSNWTLEKVRLAANGLVGWDGDIEGSDSNTGTLTFRQGVVEWNGCAETYPGRQPGRVLEPAGGGLRGRDRHRDYRRAIGSSRIPSFSTIPRTAWTCCTPGNRDRRSISGRTLARGNAGNQIKTSGPVTIENSIIVGNCGFFEGKPFTYHSDTEFDHCRAGGDALVFNPRPGDAVYVINSTVTGQGPVWPRPPAPWIRPAAARKGCSLPTTFLSAIPDIWTHLRIAVSPGLTTKSPDDLLPNDPFRTEYAIIHGTAFGNVNPCAGTQVHCYTDPGLVNSSIQSFSAYLAPGSPAIDAGSNSVCPAYGLS